MEEKIFCPNCGSENAGGSRFCMICGTTLTAAPAVAPTPVIVPEKEIAVNEAESAVPETMFEDPFRKPNSAELGDVIEEQTPAAPVAPVYPTYPNVPQVEERPEPKQPIQPKKENNEWVPQAPMAPKAPVGKKSRHIGAKIFAIFFAIILVVVGLVPTILHPVHNMLDEDNLRDAIEDADIYKVAKDLLDGEDVGDFIVDNVHVKMQGKLSPSESQIKKLFKNEEIKEFLADKLVDFATDIKEDTGDGEITGRDVYKLVKDNRDAISTALNYTLTDKELDLIEDQMKKDGLDISVETLREKYPEVSEYVTFAVSDTGLYCSYGLVLLFAIIIILICYKCVPFAFKTVGIVFFINGGIALLIRPAYWIATKVLGDVIGKYNSLITSFGAPLLNGFILVGLIFVAAGAAMIIINLIVSLITKLVAKIQAKRA